MRQKDYPRQLTIKGSSWRVRFARRIEEMGVYQTFGLCHPPERTIWIKQRQKQRIRLVLFVHETIHALEHEYGFVIPHAILNRLDYALADLILDNDLVSVAAMPKVLEIGGSMWEIKFVRNVKNEDVTHPTHFGLCNFVDHTIQVKTGLGRLERLVTVVHEVLHAIDYEYRLKLTHKIIESVQYPIAHFIMDNCRPQRTVSA